MPLDIVNIFFSTIRSNSRFCLFLILAKGLLERMQGLETYAPYQNGDHVADKSEYDHVMPQTSRYDRSKKFGTLSKSEWEATCKLISIISCI